VKYETSVVYLEQIPKVVVDTGFDWSNMWTFFATVAIFMLGTYLTIRNFSKTVASQEKLAEQTAKIQRESISSQELIARQNTLKASRQSWINDLRDTTSEFIAAALNVQRLNVYWEAGQTSWRLQRIQNAEAADRARAEWSNSHIQALRNLIGLKSKIELLLNPEEVDSKEFMKAVNELHNNCDRPDGLANTIAVDVISWCQHILKQEWEKAKSGL
jgi:hypothetical protein